MARASRTKLGTSIGERDYTRVKAAQPDEFGDGQFRFGRALLNSNVGSGPKIGSARKENPPAQRRKAALPRNPGIDSFRLSLNCRADKWLLRQE